MKIRDEAPEIDRMLSELNNLQQSLLNSAKEFEMAGSAVDFKDDDQVKITLMKINELCPIIQKEIAAHSLSHQAKERFFQDVDHLVKTRISAKLYISAPSRTYLFNTFANEDWFWRSESLSSGILDRNIYFSVLHPQLFQEARTRWQNNPRIQFESGEQEDSCERKRIEAYAKYGMPEDSSSWFWASEALSIVELSAQQIGQSLRLSDYVTWTCTHEPPHLPSGSEFGPPKLFLEATFGQRLDDPDFERLEGCRIWKAPDGSYVSPLWEYYSWMSDGDENFTEYARNLAEIGDGLDAAILSFDSGADPDDDSRLRLTPDRIFRAGEAVTKLRIKLDLEDWALKGMKADLIGQSRAAEGGKKSAKAREARRASLLDAFETIVERNPDFARLGASPLKQLAFEACREAAPALWSQGQGQLDEYIGEIRRGEAGADLQSRFYALFPKKPPKRF